MSILELHRRSGDANLGQTLIRLARMASQAHALAGAKSGDAPKQMPGPGTARLAGEKGSIPETHIPGVDLHVVDSMRAVAGGPEAVVRPVPGTDARAGGRTAHTEVRR